MNKILIFFLLHFIYIGNLFAIPAYPHKIAVTANGKTMFIRLYGDESYKHAESEDGHTIIQNEQQKWCYAVLKNDSTLEASKWLLEYDYDLNPEFKNFINTTPKHLTTTISSPVKKNIYRNESNKNVTGERKMLIILMEYKDWSFSKSHTDFARLFNEKDYCDDGAQGSVKDFYLSVSYNQLNLESDIYGPYSALHNMSYYGRNNAANNGNDANAYALFEEAITNVAANTDLAKYDGDGDGFIDNVHIIFAGYGEEAGAASDAIWSHEATFNKPYEIQGLKIDHYSCAPELRGNSGNGISRIGPHCHEIGHALGAMDYYDTDYSTGGEYAGTGQWDVMASGSWNNNGVSPADFNPYVKMFNYGWISPQILPTGKVTIQPSCNNAESYYILRASEDSDYYILENRSHEKWGSGIPGEGLLIFHVHPDIIKAGNKINATSPQKCYIVCASSMSNIPATSPASYGNINSAGCPYPGNSGNNNFGQSSTPMAFYWNGDECGIEINDITKTPDGCIHLTNNSIGTDFEYVPMRRLFFEGFENECNVNIIKSIGKTWEIEENQEGSMNIIDKPIAYEGQKCLQLSAIEDSVSGALEFSCTPQNKTGKIRFKFCYSSMKQQFSNPNLIKAGYYTPDNNEWNFIEIKSAENSKWKTKVIDIPAYDTQISFRIEGTTYAGSILAIDNIEIEQEEANEILNINKDFMSETKKQEFGIYTFTGTKIQQVRHGLNIIKMPDGTYVKVFIKK